MQWLTGWWKLNKTYKFAINKKSDKIKVSCISLTWLHTCVSYGVREQSLTPNLKAWLDAGLITIKQSSPNPVSNMFLSYDSEVQIPYHISSQDIL